MKKLIISIVLVLFLISFASATLISHWEFDGDLTDEQGNYDGVAINNTVYVPDRNGNPNSALYLLNWPQYDGVNFSDISELNNVTEYTYTAWINESWIIGVTRHILFIKGDLGSNNNYPIRVAMKNPEQELDIIIYNTSSGWSKLSNYSTKLPNDQWNHIALVYNGSEPLNSDRAKFYINGVYVPFDIVASEFPRRTANNVGHSAFLGASGPGKSGWEGYVDDMRLYDTALNSTEILEIYNGTTPTPENPTERDEFRDNTINVFQTLAIFTGLLILISMIGFGVFAYLNRGAEGIGGDFSGSIILKVVSISVGVLIMCAVGIFIVYNILS